ncbi:MAG: hypothetical protein V4616_00370 [Bacteroidota bacterium]
MEDKLEKALKELLVTSNVVILPGFGAFVATDIPAMVDSQNNVIYPPRRKVNYNPDMKQDDGVFTSHYARQERISKDTATEHIAQFVEDVQHRLHRGSPWVVEDLGKFIIDGLDHLNFFPDPDQNFVPQSFGLPEIELLTGAKPEYPEIEQVIPVAKPPVKKEEKKKEEKKKKEKPVKEKKKGGKKKVILLTLIIFALLGGGAFAFLTMTEQGKPIGYKIKHKIDELLGSTGHEAVAAVPVATTDSTTVAPADTTVVPVAENTEKPAEAKTGTSYQPRNGSVNFDTPDRVDIEPTKLDKYVKGNKEKSKQLAESKPVIASPAPAPKKETVKTNTAKAAPVPAKTTQTKAVVKETPQRNYAEPKATKVAEEAVPRNVKAVKSNESIYSKYQIVVSEYKSIEDAVESSDRYSKMGFNTAVIQFKDGKFGVCVARTSDKGKAERMLSEIGQGISSARLKEY